MNIFSLKTRRKKTIEKITLLFFKSTKVVAPRDFRRSSTSLIKSTKNLMQNHSIKKFEYVLKMIILKEKCPNLQKVEKLSN